MLQIITVEQLANWFPKVDENERKLIAEAAESYVTSRCRWAAIATDGTPLEPPAAIVQAVRLLTSRYLARRNSPDGLVGMSDELGAVRITTVDRDVENLLQPFRPVVFG